MAHDLRLKSRKTVTAMMLPLGRNCDDMALLDWMRQPIYGRYMEGIQYLNLQCIQVIHSQFCEQIIQGTSSVRIAKGHSSLRMNVLFITLEVRRLTLFNLRYWSLQP
jgi:hypothetical protein